MKIHRNKLIEVLTALIDTKVTNNAANGLADLLEWRDAVACGESIEFYDDTRPLKQIDSGADSIENAVKNGNAAIGLAMLKGAMAFHPDFAWSWHCNIAAAAMDQGVAVEVANAMAERFMRSAFDADAAVYAPPPVSDLSYEPYAHGDQCGCPICAKRWADVHLPEQIEPDAVEAWFYGLNKSPFHSGLCSYECDKCHYWSPVFVNIDRVTGWAEHHFRGDCLKPDEPTDYKSAYQYYRMMYERLLGKHGLSGFDNSKPDEPAIVSPAECDCQQWALMVANDLPSDGSRHHPDCDGQGNRKVSVAPDTVGKNDLIAEAGHEPVGIDWAKIGYCPEHHAPILSTFDGCYVCKSLEEKEMGYRDLEVGETILDGDEYFNKVINEWDTAVVTIGKPVTEARFGNYRRPIPDDTPSLSLLVCDLGESCVVHIEQGDMSKVYAVEGGMFRIIPGSTAVHQVPFIDVKAAIDALVGEDEKPLPRIQRTVDINNHYRLYTETFPSGHGATFVESDLDALNQLARQAGAASDLPIWAPKPKGVWTRLPDYSDIGMNFTTDGAWRTGWDAACNRMGATIWRFTA